MKRDLFKNVLCSGAAIVVMTALACTIVYAGSKSEAEPFETETYQKDTAEQEANTATDEAGQNAKSATDEAVQEANTAADEAGQEAKSAANKEAARNPGTGFTDLLDFTAATLDGGTFTQEDFAEKDITILYVWGTTCGYCVEELPDLAELNALLPDNMQMITYCADAQLYPDMAQKIMERRGLDVTTLVSGDGDFITLNRQLMYTPTTLFLDDEGYVVGDIIIGAPQDLLATYEAYLNDILKAMELPLLDLQAEANEQVEETT